MTDLFEGSKQASPAKARGLSDSLFSGADTYKPSEANSLVTLEDFMAKPMATNVSKPKDGLVSMDDFLSQPISPPETTVNSPETKVPAAKSDDNTLIHRKEESAPTKRAMADGMILPPSNELTATSMNAYLSDNFEILDANHDGRITAREIPQGGTFENKIVEKYNNFIYSNYYALRDLSNDDTGREQGISRSDVASLLSPRTDKAAADLITTFGESVLDKGAYIVTGVGVGLIKGLKFGNWKGALIAGALGVGLSATKGGVDLAKESYNIDDLYAAEDPKSAWRRF